jgi:hypothetical protein
MLKIFCSVRDPRVFAWLTQHAAGSCDGAQEGIVVRLLNLDSGDYAPLGGGMPFEVANAYCCSMGARRLTRN